MARCHRCPSELPLPCLPEPLPPPGTAAASRTSAASEPSLPPSPGPVNFRRPSRSARRGPTTQVTLLAASRSSDCLLEFPLVAASHDPIGLILVLPDLTTPFAIQFCSRRFSAFVLRQKGLRSFRLPAFCSYCRMGDLLSHTRLHMLVVARFSPWVPRLLSVLHCVDRCRTGWHRHPATADHKIQNPNIRHLD